MLPTLAFPVTLKIPLTLLILPAVKLAVMTLFTAPILPTLALPVMFAVPAMFAPVDAITSTLAVPPTLALTLPFVTGMLTLLVPLIIVVPALGAPQLNEPLPFVCRN